MFNPEIAVFAAKTAKRALIKSGGVGHTENLPPPTQSRSMSEVITYEF